MGLTPHDYYCMSPLEFHYASIGYMNKQWKQWERTRLTAYTIAGTVPTKEKLPPMQRWMPLPTDDASVTDNRIKAMFKKLRENG